MTKRIIVLTALLASTAVVGSAFAAGHFARFAGDPVAAIAGAFDEDYGRIVLASADGHDGHHRRREEHSERRRHHDSRDHHGRRHHDDDDDDDDHGNGRGGSARGGTALSPTGPSDPSAPMPQNGLFGGKGRPKVEVQ